MARISTIFIIILVSKVINSLHTANFVVKDLRISLPRDRLECKEDSCVTLLFCAGVRIRRPTVPKDCQYLYETVNWTKETNDFSFPLKTIWPTTPWQLTLSVLSLNGTSVFEYYHFYKEFHANSGQFGLVKENKNFSISASVEIRCERHWFGPSCRKFCVDKPGNGSLTYTCLPSGDKLCRIGWSGIDCSIPVCQNPCIHGICMGPNVCNCSIGWRGSFCESCIPLTGCQHGYCNIAGQCICHENWTEIDYCRSHSNVCLNGGTCSSAGLRGSYYCNCTKEYKGENCQTYNPTSLTCSNLYCGNGYCISSYGRSQCICPKDNLNCQNKKETMSDWLTSPLLIPVFLLFFTFSTFLLTYSCGNCCKKLTINCIICNKNKNDSQSDEICEFVAVESKKRQNSKEITSMPPSFRSPPPSYDNLDLQLLKNTRRIENCGKDRPSRIYYSQEETI